MSEESVAQEARSIARAVEQKLEDREQLHDERNAALTESVKEIKQILTWVGGTMISMILAVLAWSLLQQYNANAAQQQALHDQIVELQRAPAPVVVATSTPR